MDPTLIDELTEKGYEPCRKRPIGFGVTVTEYMEAKHCSETVARKLLDNGKAAGILGMHLMTTRDKKNPSAVYHRLGDWPPPES